MATLHVRNVPDALYERLRERARRSNRSINAETIELLAGALTPVQRLDIEEFLRRTRAKAEPLPAGAATAVELVREDRER